MDSLAPGAAPRMAARPGTVWSDTGPAVRALRKASVLVIGDAMLDEYVYGAVHRLSPEAPVPVLAVSREATLPGGAANVVRNLTALGAAVSFVSVIGDDQTGSDLTALIGGQHGVEPWLLVQGGRITSRKTRYMTGGQQLLRADREDVAPIPAKLAERLLKIARDTMAAAGSVILSDYGKGVLAPPIAAGLIAAAKQAGRTVIVDPGGGPFAACAGADIVVPTCQELAMATSIACDTERAIGTAAASLRARHGFGAVLVLRPDGGLTLAGGAEARHLPTAALGIADMSGVIDSVVAILAAALASGAGLALAARIANAAAGIAAGTHGPAVARETELLAALAT